MQTIPCWSAGYAGKVASGGFDEALTRAVLYVVGANGAVDQRCALALNVARQTLMGLSPRRFKALIREQAFVLTLEPVRALAAIGNIVPQAADRRNLLARVGAIVGAGGAPNAAEQARLAHRAKLLPAAVRRLDVPPASVSTPAARTGVAADQVATEPGERIARPPKVRFA